MSVEIYQWITITCSSCHTKRRARVHEFATFDDGTQQYGVDDLSSCKLCGADKWSIADEDS